MTNKTIRTCALALIFSGLTLLPMHAIAFTSANTWLSFSFADIGGFNEIAGAGGISVKRGQPYDETKDPADNAKVLPWGAIIMPVIVFLAFVFVFYRKKGLD